jgi:hypothetical protein
MARVQSWQFVQIFLIGVRVLCKEGVAPTFGLMTLPGQVVETALIVIEVMP